VACRFRGKALTAFCWSNVASCPRLVVLAICRAGEQAWVMTRAEDRREMGLYVRLVIPGIAGT
jgi:hypothetical protein